MCRFILAKSNHPIDPFPLLEAFSGMTEKSRTFDGDKHEDGWGIAWLDDHSKWKSQRFLSPIWEHADDDLSLLSPSQYIVIHARSASFTDQKGVVAYNQPYVEEPYAFVFNGLLKGVSFSPDIAGEIGAQKIWSLLQRFLKKFSPEEALQKIKTVLERKSSEIQALNVGLCDKENIYSLNVYSGTPESYQLHVCKKSTISLISSEPIEGYEFEKQKDTISML
jgi:predicted glutamine amidotransferase